MFHLTGDRDRVNDAWMRWSGSGIVAEFGFAAITINHDMTSYIFYEHTGYSFIALIMFGALYICFSV